MIVYTSAMKDITETNDAPLQEWHGRAILLVDLDAFFASVEQLDHPAWRGLPVIVGGDADRRGVVSTCSYEARAFGVRSAMPASLARELCPDAIWARGRFARYREMSNVIMNILRDETPYVQQVSIDEAFMDVTPNTINVEHPARIAERIQRRVEELGVTCSIGVGVSKSVAKIASDKDKPRGITVVYPGSEASFLAPLPVRTLSGVGPVAEKYLVSHGVRTLGDMANADESILRGAFGKNASMMRDRARGSDRSPVESDESVKSVSHESTFAKDLTTRDEIEAAIRTLAVQVGRRLRRKGLAGKTVSLRVRYADRTSRSAQTALPRRSDDELYFAPILCALLDDLWQPGMRVRLLGVAVTGFDSDDPTQESLFDIAEFANSDADSASATPEESKKKRPSALQSEETRRSLLQATDKLKDMFGESAVRFGHELRNEGNTTGTGSKNPADYK